MKITSLTTLGGGFDIRLKFNQLSRVAFKLDVMTFKERLTYIGLFGCGITLVFAFGGWWFSLIHIPKNFQGGMHIIDIFLFLLLTYIVWHQIVMDIFAWYISGYVTHPVYAPPTPGLRVAYLTAFVPGSEPYSLLEKTLKAMATVDYPHDTWLLDEGASEEAKALCEKYGVRHYSRKDRDEFNTTSGKFTKKTKGGNYNSWLHHHIDKYDIVAQHDMDFIPRHDFLTRTLGQFSDPSIAFVGTPQIYGNLTDSWIARGAAEQTYAFYGPIQKGFHGHDMTLLIGANHIFRTKAYNDIGGYTAHITEDMLTGMKLYSHSKKWKSVYVAEPLLIGEGPSTWDAYFAQQMRWAYGCMDIAFRHAPALLPKMKLQHILNYTILMQFYFTGIAQVVGIALLTLYFLFGWNPTNMTLFPILVLYLPLLVFQLVFQLWLQRFNVLPKEEKGLLLCGKLLTLAVWPIYFLAFIGAIIGKKLTYVVTPKGSEQDVTRQPSLFYIHSLLGGITLLGIIVGIIVGNTSGAMMFWAVLNTVFMFYFAITETTQALYASLQRI